LTHLLILDDDAVLSPGTLATLAEAMERERASLAYPLVADVNGHVGWLPGLKEPLPGVGESFDGSPGKFRARFGDEPRDFIWAQGVCLLVNREAVDHFGLHRDDFWVRGEDLEFSLRYTVRSRGIFVPTAVVEHLPPNEDSEPSREAEYLKHCALVQNIAFIGYRLPHGYRIAWTVAGATRRLVRMWTWRAAGDALRAWWRGAVRGEPAGAGSGNTFRARFDALTSLP
jgi:GT2 family glycosyltransferase